MSVRFAAADDIPALVRLRFDFFGEDPELAMAKNQEEAVRKQLYRYYQAHLNMDFYAALAVENGQIAAASFLVIQEKPANAHFPTGKTGLILNVYTYPQYRRKGYAAGTLRLLIDKAKEEEVSYLELQATSAGKPVYVNLGFVDADHGSCTEMRLRLNYPL